MNNLRKWQKEALTKYLAPHNDQSHPYPNYVVTATPGAGKTTFALTTAQHLLQKRAIDQIIIVVPTDHLRTQWADAAKQFGIHLDANLTNQNRLRPELDGYVTTYAQVAAKPAIHHNRVENHHRTFVILDEIHHTADGTSWGEAIQHAFDGAYRRLVLTGTLYRTSTIEKIPYVTYTPHDPDTGIATSMSHYTYSYGQALQDGVVRPVMFAAYAGIARWRDDIGTLIATELTETQTQEEEKAAWKTILNPNGQWVTDVISASHQRLLELRATTTPDAGCLILASDQDSAKHYARIVQRVTGEKPALVISDDPKASKKIEAFNNDTASMYLVAVRMVSEGVDVRRLSCLVWLTNYQTPLFFAQAVGRVLRARNRHETATVFLPAVKPLLQLAAEMDEERDHAVRNVESDAEETEPDDPRKNGTPLDDEERTVRTITPVDSQARFDRMLFGGEAINVNPTRSPDSDPYAHLPAEEANLLGIPGLLSEEQATLLLAEERARNVRQPEPSARIPAPRTLSVKDLRKEISSLASQWARRRGVSVAQAHIDTKRAVPGPGNADAPREILQQRRDYLLSKTT